MGTKRESVESKIISYFRDESDEKIEMLFGIIKGIVARRAPAKKSKEPKAAGKQKSEPKVEERSNGPAAFTKIAGDA